MDDDDVVVDDVDMVSFDTDHISSKLPSSSQAKKQRTDVVDDAAMVSFETDDISASINANQAFASQQKIVSLSCSCKGDCTSRRCQCRSKSRKCSENCKCCANRCMNQPARTGTICVSVRETISSSFLFSIALLCCIEMTLLRAMRTDTKPACLRFETRIVYCKWWR